ncbi:Peroxidase stcC-like protein [Cladobotryum mycophilum]|uniref:Peroxidase stcC-like protein n=1 Tax=Cladobotryum mycophilum TaxID=491253 RepID=A0ABR0SBT3_9HYPO
MIPAIIISFAALALAAVCPGTPVRRFIPPTSCDSRSPCPMLNTLANHNYLPHNGRNVSVQQIEAALTDVLNVEPAFADSARAFAQAWGHDSFDLEDLNTPDILQHISSLTRADYSPQHHHLRPDLFRIEALLADSPTPFVTVESIARTRLRDDAESKPNIMLQSQVMSTIAEAAMVLMMMMDKAPAASSKPELSAFQGPKNRLRIWLEQERFPTELGWRPSARRILLADLKPAMTGIVESMRAQSEEA